jgi:hypothetical protein
MHDAEFTQPTGTLDWGIEPGKRGFTEIGATPNWLEKQAVFRATIKPAQQVRLQCFSVFLVNIA